MSLCPKKGLALVLAIFLVYIPTVVFPQIKNTLEYPRLDHYVGYKVRFSCEHYLTGDELIDNIYADQEKYFVEVEQLSSPGFLDYNLADQPETTFIVRIFSEGKGQILDEFNAIGDRIIISAIKMNSENAHWELEFNLDIGSPYAVNSQELRKSKKIGQPVKGYGLMMWNKSPRPMECTAHLGEPAN